MQEWFRGKISDATVLDLSVEVYRKKLKSIIGYQILFTIIMILLFVVGMFVIVPMITWITLEGAGGLFSFVVFVVIMIILLGTLMGMNKAGIFYMVYSYINGENLCASEGVGKAFSSFKQVFRLVCAFSICVLPILIILGLGGMTVTTITLWQSKMASSTLTAILIGGVLFSVVSAILGSYLFYSLHIAIFDHEKGFASMKKSIQFAKGEVLRNAFRVFSIFIFEWGVSISFYSAIAAISALVYFLLGKVAGGESIITQIMLWGDKLKVPLDFILGILLAPMSSIIWTFYYMNMKYKKEGLKIHNMMDELEEEEELPKSIDIHYE
ncbi:glycerophosphoryl diester phosphodiesterase membrane domain-containing protein [Inediibacterium massiliense]|uniref:glycerophosphoryl diester phosphodiesterase membrane domain-containing protein n=1 Tax=Inediibacterium massiliense TaxID=1658111 RepID=UPI0006B622B9|nr:glycerophosphoryl diester phosphodiesterase membrane domain-containing protein [Inediibacterium massiliense]